MSHLQTADLCVKRCSKPPNNFVLDLSVAMFTTAQQLVALLARAIFALAVHTSRVF